MDAWIGNAFAKMKLNGITQKALADKMGYTGATVCPKTYHIKRRLNYGK